MKTDNEARCIWAETLINQVEDRSTEIIKWLKQPVEDGLPQALKLMGDLYMSGIGVEKDQSQAFVRYKQSAEAGLATGESRLGDCYKYGLGVERNLPLAVEQYSKAVEQDDLDAMQELAEILIEGSDGVEKDDERGFELLKRAAESGHAEAQWMLGTLFINPNSMGVTCVEQDLAEGIKWMLKSSEQSFGMAECTLASFYLRGVGVEKDVAKAKELYTRALAHGGLIKEMEDDAKAALAKLEAASSDGKESNDEYPGMDVNANDEDKAKFKLLLKHADDGDSEAMLDLYSALFSGENGAVEDKKIAFVWCKKAAESGSVEGMKELGDCYRDGVGCEVDAENAINWYEKSATAGNSIAQWRLARLYEDGDLVERDDAKSFKYYKMNSEQHSDRTSTFKVGMAYYFGKGVEENEPEAFKWFEKAATQGHAKAMCRYAECFRYGNGTDKNFAKAIEWYRKSAEEGEALAQENLAMMYYKGLGAEKDLEEAFKWFKKAADEDRDKAQFWVGKFYAEGLGGVEKDLSKAVEWYEKSAEQDNTDAICALGWCYQLGTGVEQDFAKAAEWFRKGADQDDGFCMNNLARLVEDGKGVDQDYDEALALFKKAAENDCARANYHIGRFYENGLGCDKDIDEAKVWYQKAAEDGDKDAKTALERLG